MKARRGHALRSRERLRAVVRQDRGASPVEFAIVAAAMLFLSFAVVQVGLVFYARSIALAAATQGANAARGYNANNEAGQAASQRFLDAAGDGLRDQNITVRRVGNDITVTVTGNAVSVLPGFSFGINQSARGSIERVT